MEINTNKTLLLGLAVMLVGTGVCFSGNTDSLWFGSAVLFVGVILFLVSALARWNTSRKSKIPVKRTVGTVLLKILLILLTLAVVGVGGCFAILGMSVN